MCLVIDTNTLKMVFQHTNKKHSEFKPVLDWIINGNGKIIIGGTTFEKELFEEMKWFIKAFRLLRQHDKVVEINTKLVDKREELLKSKVQHKDFDDPHIVALLGISGSRLLCTGDLRSFRFIQDKKLYPKGKLPPAIYTKSKNKDLLCSNNLAPCCMPKTKLPKTVRNNLPAMIS